MEELFILQYRGFTALGQRVKYDAQQIGHFKRVTDWALHGQLYLNKLRSDHMGWTPPRMETLLNGAPALQSSLHVAEGEREEPPKTPSSSGK